MTSDAELLRSIRAEFLEGRYRFTLHAIQEATRDRIAVEDVVSAVLDEKAVIIEDYPEDPRGPSCLILSWTQTGSTLHLAVAYPPDPAVITVYRPDPDKWVDYRIRREQ